MDRSKNAFPHSNCSQILSQLCNKSISRQFMRSKTPGESKEKLLEVLGECSIPLMFKNKEFGGNFSPARILVGQL